MAKAGKPAKKALGPSVAVWKFASCDGCQLSLLDCEDALLAVAGAIHIANFPEASRAVEPGPYAISLVEGSVTTPHDVERIKEIRAQSGLLVTLGACATSGGIQALRNLKDSGTVQEWVKYVYASPEFIHTLDTSSAIADHVKVDLELRGCPINKMHLVEVVVALLNGRKPNIPSHSVCMECKLRQTSCVMVSKGTPCLGPVTMAGCGALCPSYERGCYGCFGPMEAANAGSLAKQFGKMGLDRKDTARQFAQFNVGAPEFLKESKE